VVSPSGNVALIERRKPGRRYWAVPGGGIERGETAAEAAVREVREELGLQVTLEEWSDQRGPQVFFLALVDTESQLSLGGPERERNSPDNHYEPVWVPIRVATDLWLRPAGAADALTRLRRTSSDSSS
jgi:8-oxo-dGTP pyrophosphatase MutT (NUDIX family)